ncbi:hypothetical protein AWJ20_250 [Sugiyamaella lignohabitans]|uniref:Alpha/beta hydrolase fold-3 domain-containing protein n=1 Tax=Sugiyamaella lignohabitans TaxID=796027 RepID=A0A161HK87_9ASCO|nr:uncharacterized protein AWJ20_250 [Sugiyamaella lignohabitans]ANB12018.1 hypothetical protein AWJ20_250 [Sugiyamaella lignohabitans]
MRLHIKYLISLYRAINNPRLSILAIDYSLAPEVVFPAALTEIATVYSELVDHDGCNNIILSGDSAGGNLCIVLSAHLKHHYEDLSVPSRYVQPIAEVLISPWVELDPVLQGSYVSNKDSDVLGGSFLKEVSKLYCPDNKLQQSPFVNPARSKPEFWEGVFPEKTLVTFGQNEIMRDDIIKFARIASIEHRYGDIGGFHCSVLSAKNYDQNKLFNGIVSFIQRSLQQTVGLAAGEATAVDIEALESRNKVMRTSKL